MNTGPDPLLQSDTDLQEGVRNQAQREGARRSLSWPKTVVFSILPVLSLLLIGEGGLRVYSWYFRTAYERYDASTGRLELVPNMQVKIAGGRRIGTSTNDLVEV